MAIRITRRNPRTGHTERPWRNRDGLFVLGDPAHGAQKHHDKFAVKVGTLEEAAALVRRGFSLRMTDGESPPALITPDSLILDEVEADETGLWAETAPRPPFGKEEMFAELQHALLVQASQIAYAGSFAHAAAFIGFETADPTDPYREDDPERVNLRRFNATVYLDRAYDYAFQVGPYWRFGDDTAQDLQGLLRTANNDSPLTDPEKSLCRHATDMALGRWQLKQGNDLTVRELTLLAAMKEPAMRNSLSKERIAIVDGKVDGADALQWLKGRRDFVPTRTEEGHKARWVADSRRLLDREPFPQAFGRILEGFDLTPAELAAKARVPEAFVAALAAGRPQPDLEVLQRVGAALELDAPHFVGVAIQAALRAGDGA